MPMRGRAGGGSATARRRLTPPTDGARWLPLWLPQNKHSLRTTLLFPDEVSALTLKALPTGVRIKHTDIVDIWRCLEIRFATGVDAASFNRGAAPGGAAGHRYTRIRALIARLLPSA